MKTRLPDRLVQEIFQLGQAIDIGQSVNAFDGGEVGLGSHSEEKESSNEREGTGGSAAGSRQGAEGSRGSSGQARDSLGRVWPEWIIDDGLIPLLGSYPGCGVSPDEDGAWLRVPMRPLGKDGPLALLVIALPVQRAIHPRCWAFWVEPIGVRWIGPRHTNYPYGDACAFPQFAGYWERRDGLRSYVDIHAEWLIRQLHHEVFDRWVGRQMAPFALYALNQFGSLEQCHCKSGRRYGECCQSKDFAEWRTAPERQARLALNFTQWGWFNSQRPPREITQFVLGAKAPGLAHIYTLYRELVRFSDRASVWKGRLRCSVASVGLTAQSTAWKLTA